MKYNHIYSGKKKPHHCSYYFDFALFGILVRRSPSAVQRAVLDSG